MKKILIAVVALVAVVAWASNIPRAHLNAATGTQVFCAGAPGRPLSVQCDLPVRLATGVLLGDAGSARTSDGGAAIVADTNDTLVIFPGDPYKVQLGQSEQCIGVISEGADGGTNNCNYFEVNAAP